jgi:hypothetical protein
MTIEQRLADVTAARDALADMALQLADAMSAVVKDLDTMAETLKSGVEPARAELEKVRFFVDQLRKVGA